jgi:hypothetical protein
MLPSPTPGTIPPRQPPLNGVKTPDSERQEARLAPQMRAISSVFNSNRLRLSRNGFGIDPEIVLVIQLLGTLRDFSAVLQKHGLEPLLHWEDKEDSDDDFFAVDPQGNKTSAQLSSFVYLTLAGEAGKDAFLRNWRLYVSGYEFQKGERAWKDIFRHLSDVRPWGPDDRLRATGTIEEVQRQLGNGADSIRIEAECWGGRDPEKQLKRLERLSTLLKAVDGVILRSEFIPETRHLGAIISIPRTAFSDYADPRDLFRNELDIDVVRIFAPVGQSVVFPSGVRLTSDAWELPGSDFDASAEPRIALLDGLPLENHVLLGPRVQVDDPDGFSSDYRVDKRVHGTAMASLIIHGDLNRPEPALSRPIYVRPVLMPAPDNSLFDEEFPDDYLMSDLIRRSVDRLYGGDESPGVAPFVRVVNLSLSDQSRVFERAVSPLARVIDWLSWKHDVLFCICAGNADVSIVEPDTSGRSIEALTEEEIEEITLGFMRSDTVYRNITSPAESINAITVGASHTDLSAYVSRPGRDRLLLSDPSTPSLESRIGFGFQRSIKPDILLPGGRILYRKTISSPNTAPIFRRVTSLSTPPGQRVAVPGATPGDNAGWAFSTGTSNATALATRNAALLLEMLDAVYDDEGDLAVPEEFKAVAVKALLVHCASWGDVSAGVFRLVDDLKSTIRKRHTSRYIGYGPADVTRVLSCTDTRVTAIGFGEVSGKRQSRLFDFPIPESFAEFRGKKTLSRTLAWISPIEAGTSEYRKAILDFASDTEQRKDLLLNDRMFDHNIVKRGTVVHECFETKKVTVVDSQYSLGVQVNCNRHPVPVVKPTKFAVALTLELVDPSDILLYEEIQQRLRARVRMQT